MSQNTRRRNPLAHFYVERDGKFDVIRPPHWSDTPGDSYFPEYVCTAETADHARAICDALSAPLQQGEGT